MLVHLKTSHILRISPPSTRYFYLFFLHRILCAVPNLSSQDITQIGTNCSRSWIYYPTLFREIRATQCPSRTGRRSDGTGTALPHQGLLNLFTNGSHGSTQTTDKVYGLPTCTWICMCRIWAKSYEETEEIQDPHQAGTKLEETGHHNVVWPRVRARVNCMAMLLLRTMASFKAFECSKTMIPPVKPRSLPDSDPSTSQAPRIARTQRTR